MGTHPWAWQSLPSGQPHSSPRYLGTAPGGAGALATDAHAEALEAAVGVAGAQVEGAGHTLVAQAPHHVVLEGQSWELQGGPREVGGVGGAPCTHILPGLKVEWSSTQEVTGELEPTSCTAPQALTNSGSTLWSA